MQGVVWEQCVDLAFLVGGGGNYKTIRVFVLPLDSEDFHPLWRLLWTSCWLEDIFINPLRINKLLDNNYYKVQGYILPCSNKYKPKGKLPRKSKRWVNDSSVGLRNAW